MEFLKKFNEYSMISPEIIPMVYDIIRTVVIQVVVQVLFYMNNPGVELFTSIFFQTTVFLILGVIIFWLIAYKLMANTKYFNMPFLYHAHNNDRINDIKEKVLV
uniref:Uncharacterized protein n=1 Tax=viral metagenome TaxID=1070528 RepID=A0A6C0F7F2_9ZZZZ|tara:strand:+ start:889 stop:1200 length:312 start_codon:yes stop_codon:yes gene_type:complete